MLFCLVDRTTRTTPMFQRCVDLMIRFGFMNSAARISPGGIGSCVSVFAIAIVLDGPESERKISDLGATGALFHRMGCARR
jgi:hypothetical protein